MKVLAIIPARAGSKRIKNKNIKDFLGKPLIAYTIKHALKSLIIDRTLVCTESDKIAKIAKKHGAEVPFLRPKKLAQDNSDVDDSILYTLKWLKDNEGYEPDYFIILQATSPLRELDDIKKCFDLIKKTKATTVLTVSPTHPKLYNLSKANDAILVNGSEKKQSTTQLWEKAYLLNGCVVYVVNTKAFLKEGHTITKNTKAVVMPKWRSVDLDDPEEWALAEVLFENKSRIKKTIKKIEK